MRLGQVWEDCFVETNFPNHFPTLTRPAVVSRTLWNLWMECQAIDAASVHHSGRVIQGDPSLIAVQPSREMLLKHMASQYAALLSLRNNWRPIKQQQLTAFYSRMLGHIQSYMSLCSDDSLPYPNMGELPPQPTAEAYQKISRKLDELAAQLSPE